MKVKRREMLVKKCGALLRDNVDQCHRNSYKSPAFITEIPRHSKCGAGKLLRREKCLRCNLFYCQREQFILAARNTIEENHLNTEPVTRRTTWHKRIHSSGKTTSYGNATIKSQHNPMCDSRTNTLHSQFR